ncbi:pole-organizing protein PopZ [Aliidongia dinghuensis]|uniref:Pole-organizing protein PopZ n=1 Tax=Aliidongia dinghuensis TaxID=1867774 RepID=A0A8J3E2T3_9PROT|nr:DUF2497 domain-containing protein [Aliidongia dinghuensis]GGF13545.1 pole-organizing protein PopZ [Aliidongia dinghuensis]
MEEILASIRRIIAEDNDAEKPAEEAAAPPPLHVAEPEPISAPAPVAAMKDDVLELTEVVEDEPEPEPQAPYEPEEPLFQPRRFEMPEDPTEGLVSRATAAASTAAFAAMHSRVRERRDSDVYLGNGAITLEELVRELLRPQLQDWLDRNLPGMVERLVREEIERLARAAK